MAKTTNGLEQPLTLRVASELVTRLDNLIPRVAADSAISTMLGGVTRSSVLRLALVKGLGELERRHPSAFDVARAHVERLFPGRVVRVEDPVGGMRTLIIKHAKKARVAETRIELPYELDCAPRELVDGLLSGLKDKASLSRTKHLKLLPSGLVKQ